MISAEEQERRMKLYEEGKTDTEIALACFICVNAVKYWRGIQNPPFPPNPNIQLTDRLEERQLLYNEGLTVEEIAERQKVSKTAVRDWCRRRGYVIISQIKSNA